MQKKITIRKLSEKIYALTEESNFYIPLPRFVEKIVRQLSDIFLHNRVIAGKIIYTSTVMSVLNYLPYQIIIGLTVAIGTFLAPLRRLFSYCYPLKRKNAPGVYSQIYAFFPSHVHAIVYRNHIPVPFMPFQVDRKTIATSLRDTHFAKQAFRMLSISGFRTMAWASNYLLGYQKNITVSKHISQKYLRTFLITTTASIPGYNQGLNDIHYFRTALQKKYAEESFYKNEKSIHFAKNNVSPIIRAVVIEKIKNELRIQLVKLTSSLSYLTKSTTVGVIYPIALLTSQNVNHPDWNKTPAKNISGFILAFDKKTPVCIALSSSSLIRIKINHLLPFIDTICYNEKLKFYCYVHTDDGGAVGDFYQEGGSLKRYGPLWGHCISSFVGFTHVAQSKKTLRVLKNWSVTKSQKYA